MADLNINIVNGPSEATSVVELNGELDESNVETLSKQMDGVFANAAVKTVIFNLQNLIFINSKGIGYLVSVQTHLAKDQRRFNLVAANQEVMDVISLVGLTAIIPYYSTLEEAYANL
jgi:anti-anti-sigma factor